MTAVARSKPSSPALPREGGFLPPPASLLLLPKPGSEGPPAAASLKGLGPSAPRPRPRLALPCRITPAEPPRPPLPMPCSTLALSEPADAAALLTSRRAAATTAAACCDSAERAAAIAAASLLDVLLASAEPACMVQILNLHARTPPAVRHCACLLMTASIWTIPPPSAVISKSSPQQGLGISSSFLLIS
jgi:hypothetical protein